MMFCGLQTNRSDGNNVFRNIFNSGKKEFFASDTKDRGESFYPVFPTALRDLSNRL